MKIANQRTVRGRVCGLFAGGLALTLSAIACNGQISDHGKSPVDNPPPAGVPANGDVGRVAIHRLNNLEYDNTVKDLLGVPSMAKGFIEDEKAGGFDTIAAAFGMTDARYEQYFNSSTSITEAAFADDTLRGKIVTCMPASAGDVSCAKTIIKAFGLRAYRRPLTDAEVDSLTKLGTDALAAGEDFPGSIKQVVRTMLASAPFLYRVEMDANPSSMAPHRLTGYELASRLSYLNWSTMPDDQLFQLAASDKILEDGTLNTQIDRMLADGRSSSFVNSFGGQWLGMRGLQQHQVSATAFPAWSEALRDAMIKEATLYFSEFLTGDNKMTDFFTTDVNFVSGPLAALYGMTGGAAAGQPMKISNTTDQRLGFMGLASFLTQTSFDYRTAPTLRGKWVLENLLCTHIPPPPDNVPELDDKTKPQTDLQSQNVRIRLAAHRANPTCNACHQTLDPIGFGLENFDGIGKYRTTYPNGDAIDASGDLQGQKFDGLPSLATMLAKDTRLTDCAAEKMMTYALSRELGASDQPFLTNIRKTWGGAGLRALLKEVVLNPTFRNRRGESM